MNRDTYWNTREMRACACGHEVNDHHEHGTPGVFACDVPDCGCTEYREVTR